MSDVRGALEQLTPEQRAQLAARLRERRQASTAAQRIAPRPDHDVRPLSPAQTRIWRLSRLRPNDPVYNLHQATRLQGHVDVDALRAAFTQVVARHETLRAVFVDDHGEARQEVTPPGHLEFVVADVDDGLEEARSIARREAERPFDLARGPLLRVRLVRLGDDDHVLLVTTHHIVCDGWSIGVIEDEVSTLYRAALAGEPADLDETELQYADVAHWQHVRGRDSAEQGLSYWAEQLGADVERLRLPGDAERPSGRSHTGGHHTGGHHAFEVPTELRMAIDALGRTDRVTPFAVTMAAFLVLLNRHTGQDDLVVCTPVAGRDRHETERMVGYFNNLVVIRGDLSGDPTFRDVLRRLQPVMAGAFDHQRVPFQDVAALPHLAAVPLARALFVLQDARNRALSLPDVTTTILDVEAASADFDLGIFLRPEGDHLSGVVRHRTAQFDDAAIGALLDDFRRVLRRVLEEPDVRLSDLQSFAAPAAVTRAGDRGPLRLPQTPLESQLRDIWERLFRRSPIGVDDDFFELGGHSLLAAELAAEVEQVITDEPLPLATLFAAPTIERLATLIDSGSWGAAWSALVPIQAAGTRSPLFFVHAHGGNVIGYRDLARRLGPDQPLYGLQSPTITRDRDQIAMQHIPEMAEHYLREIRDVQPHGPYHLGGWCLGGDVAYEMAVQLAAAGEHVASVIMVDNPRPSHIRTSTGGSIARQLVNRARTRLAMEWSNLRLADPAYRSTYVRRRVSRVGGSMMVRVVERVSTALTAMSVAAPSSRALRRHRIAQANEKAYEAYDPPHYAGRVTLFRAEQQPMGRADDPSLGWATYVDGTLEIYDVPGHRVGMLSEPRVAELAKMMLAVMNNEPVRS